MDDRPLTLNNKMATHSSKRQKTAHPDTETPSHSKAFYQSAASWDLEADWESRRRKSSKKDKRKEKESTRLPIKLADGRIQQVPGLEGDGGESDDDAWLDNSDAEGTDEDQDDRPQRPAEPEIPEPEQIRNAKEELVKIALMMNQDPEANIGSLKTLAEIGRSRVEAVKRLALATQMAVYKDIIPGYRIRSQAEAQAVMLSKEVRKQRAFEHGIVTGFGSYVKELAQCARSKSSPALASVAVACACSLVTAVPHFNFRTDLLKILIGKLSRKKADGDSVRCVQALQKLFREGVDEGRPSLEAVSLLSKMMRTKEFRVDEGVVNLFLHLRLLDEFGGTGSADQVQPDGDGARKRKQWQYLSKRQRKDRKEHKKLEKEMDQADAVVSHEERDKNQSEMLRHVFGCYFRILKARTPHLMGAVLEGLSRYAHLMNQEFFGDILEALKDLIRYSIEDATIEEEEDAPEPDEEEDDGLSARNLTRESLLCTSTAFALLAGQDAHMARNALHLDISFFITHLFTSLLPTCTHPDLEMTPKALRLRAELTQHLYDDSASTPSATSKVNAHTTTVLLVRSLTAVLLPRWRMRTVPPERLAAFSKHLMASTLQLPEKSAQAVLALMGDVVREHGGKVAGMWRSEERRGDGAWAPLSTTVEGSNPRSTSIFEGELLRKHYSPAVREGLTLLEKAVAES